jgi:hypothetical protein
VSPLRRVLVPLAGAIAIAAVGGSLVDRFYADPTFLPPLDFLQYWAAGRLLPTNPYDAAALAALQAANGSLEAAAVVNWQPPWALAVCGPFGLLPARTAQLVWLTLQVGLIAGCCLALWRLYGGAWDRSWVAVGLGLTFPPTMFLLHEGQCGGWLLLGLTGWLLAERGGAGWAALLAFCALKPHLFAPLGVAILLHAGRDGRTAKRFGIALLAGTAAAGVVTAVNPWVWTQYLDALSRPPTEHHRPLTHWHPPLVGYWLRALLAPDRFWVQFLPVLAGCLATPVYYWQRRDAWDWVQETPRLVFAGAFVAPYSGWVFDLVVLLVPLTAVAARLSLHASRLQLAAVLVGVVLVWVAIAALGWVEHDGSLFVWVTPTLAAGCPIVAWVVRPTESLK